MKDIDDFKQQPIVEEPARSSSKQHALPQSAVPDVYDIENEFREDAEAAEKLAAELEGRSKQMVMNQTITSPKPGSIFWQIASVASGVMSRGPGPVPPVVITKGQRTLSQRSIRVFSKRFFSSGINFR